MFSIQPHQPVTDGLVMPNWKNGHFLSLRSEPLENREMLDASAALLTSTSDQNSWSNWSAKTADETIVIHAKTEGAPPSKFEHVLAADFTADGVDDILSRSDNDWLLTINSGNRLFTAPWGSAPPTSTEIIGTGDLNGDGLTDIVSFESDTGEVWASVNSLGEGFETIRWSAFSTNANWLDFFVADFNGDGFDDVLAAESNGDWWLAKSTGNSFHNNHWGRFLAIDWSDMSSGDFDGDGISDIAARAADQTWWVWQGGTDGFQPTKYWGHWNTRSTWHDVNVGDFDGDGRSDLIGRSEDDRVWVGISQEGQFRTTPWVHGWLHAADWSNVQLADINGDNKLDQVGRANDGTWWYAKNMGDRFQVQFWNRGPSNAIVSQNFHREFDIDVTKSLLGPGVTLRGSFPQVDTSVKVTVDENNMIVVTGNGQELIGIELTSPGGGLIPWVGDQVPGPFEFTLVKSPNRITLAILTTEYPLDGPLTFDVGWNPNSVPDLTVQVGYRDHRIPYIVEVDPTLGSTPEELPEHIGSRNVAAWSQRIYP